MMSGDTVSPNQNAEWQAHFLEFLLPRLTGNDADKEQVLEMLFSAFEKRYREGIHDAALFVRSIGEGDPRVRHVANVLANGLDELERMNTSKNDGRRLSPAVADRAGPPAPGR